MSSSRRPIITFHIGNYSNFIGTHWLNSQMNHASSDSNEDSSIFWKESLSRDKKRILTPRALLFDLDCNWPRKQGTSAEELERTEAGWDGEVNRVIGAKEKKTLEVGSPGSVPERWSDYLEWKLEGMEKATFPISSFTYNSTQGVLSNFEDGVEIYSSLHEGITDSIRLYAEDCDNLEGFLLLFDQDDGFGGIGSGILTHVADEYDKKCRLAIGTSPATNSRWVAEKRIDAKLRLMNSALAWSSCYAHASLFTSISLSDDLFRPFPQPCSLPRLSFKSNYESSAILATAIDTLTLPFVSNSHSFGLADIAGLLNVYGRKMTTFGFTFPLDIEEHSLYEILKEHGTGILRSLTPSRVSLDLERSLGNYFVIRGVGNEKVMRRREEIPGLSMPTSGSCLEFFSREFCPKSLNVVKSVESPFKMSHPFPSEVVEQTFLTTLPKTKFRGKDCWDIGVLASAHNSTAPGHALDRLLSQVKLESVKDLFQRRNLETDDYAESMEGLRTLREAYLPES